MYVWSCRSRIVTEEGRTAEYDGDATCAVQFLWGVVYAIDQSEPRGTHVRHLDYDITERKLSEHVAARTP